jgi:hypothetical protein
LATASTILHATNAAMDEIIKEFLTESLEGLDQLDTKFVMLEQNPE